VDASEIDQLVARNVYLLRAERNYSQQALASRAGMAASNVAFAEKGTRRLVTRSFCRLVGALDVRPHVLFLPLTVTPCRACWDDPPPAMICSVCRKIGPALHSLLTAD
jgi:transcriptional regulator with XRE-family HTH domain